MKRNKLGNRVIALVLITSFLLTGCSTTNITPENSSSSSSDDTNISESNFSIEISDKIVDPESFKSLSDVELQSYVEDNIYATVTEQLASDDYQVVNVKAKYVSQEYIEELAYNSQSNIYFGYTLDELEAQFGDDPYIFTVGEDGQTTVQIAEPYDDTYNTIVRNVAIGGGVILICVTVAVVSGGLAAAPGAAAGVQLINTIFVTAAKDATVFALTNGAISGVAAGLVTGYQTRDYQEALNAGALAASEGFMWGAISGAIIGGISGYAEAPAWMKTSDGHPTWSDSEVDIARSIGAQEQQVSYIGGEEVPLGTPGSTRPDAIIQNADNTITAIETKNYDLENNLSQLGTELQRQIGQRVVDLPTGSSQSVYIDVRGRGYSTEFLNNQVLPYLESMISEVCPASYPKVPIVFYGG